MSGHSPDSAHFMSVATETFIKEVLSSIFSKTRSNGPGTSGSAGTGGGANWIQTHQYRDQLEREEEASLRSDVHRDKNGLLPIEAKAASERGPLGMADVHTALEIGDCGLGQMPAIRRQILDRFREGEIEGRNDYSYPAGYEPQVRIVGEDVNLDIEMGGVNGTNGHDVDTEDWGWEGCEKDATSGLDDLLDSLLVN